MKRKIQISGHQRSGNHYLAALIELNLFGAKDYQGHIHPGGHVMGRDFADNNLWVATYRSWPNTLRSLWKFRHRLNLDAPTFEDFAVSTIGDLYGKNKNSDNGIMINWHFKRGEQYGGKSAYFSSPNHKELTLERWHAKYVTSWLEAEKRNPDNIVTVSYDRLINECTGDNYRDFILSRIAHLAGIEGIDLPTKDIKVRVGWFPKKDKDWRRK